MRTARVSGFLCALWIVGMAQPREAIPQGSFLAVSLNLAREKDAHAIAEAISHDRAMAEADVLLFQEVAGQTADSNVAEAVARELGYFSVTVNSAPESPNQGLSIVSRHPLQDLSTIPLRRFDLGFHSRVRFAIAASALTPMGPVRIWNVHLDSRINPVERVEQLRPVLEDMRKHEGPALVGGDFNTTRFQWTFRMLPTRMGMAQIETVRKAVEAAGFQASTEDRLVTFPFLAQHLDWIFARGLARKAAGASLARFSDHHAVWASFEPETRAALVH